MLKYNSTRENPHLKNDMSCFKYSETDFEGFLNLINTVKSVKFHNDNINIEVYNAIKKWVKELPQYKNKKLPKKYELTE